MTSYHVGFRVAPRINAAGRMDVARHVVELFECDTFEAARGFANLLDSRNRERQTIQQQITELALSSATTQDSPHFVVVAGEGWHRGVIGLAASRIAERLHRPTIVLSTENGIAHGSARSIGNFHVLRAMESCADLFEQFGGHAAAAGMRIATSNIDMLRERLNEFTREVLSEEDISPILHVDALVSPGSLTLGLVDDLCRLEPFGPGNPKPVFATRGLFLRSEPMVMKDKHLKMWLQDDQGNRFEAVWWDGIERSNGQTPIGGQCIEIAYSPEANLWQGNRRLQLVVHGLRADN